MARPKKLQTPDGAEAKPEVAAAPPVAAEAKADNVKDASAADPAGAGAAPTAEPERSRDQTETVAADRKASVEGGNEPQETDRPPVVGPIVTVRSRSARGRRRAGLAFGPEPRALTTDEIGPVELAALQEDPELIVELLLD